MPTRCVQPPTKNSAALSCMSSITTSNISATFDEVPVKITDTGSRSGSGSGSGSGIKSGSIIRETTGRSDGDIALLPYSLII
jgi:hypothetical protein